MTKKKAKAAPAAVIPAWPVYSVKPWPVADLVPYARNARLHSDEQVKALALLIQEFGWTMPILVDEAGEIIAGHGRVLAARYLGLDEVPVAVAEGWTDEQKRAYRIADNRLSELSTWDEDLLRIEIGDLNDLGADLTLTGFDTSSLDKILAAANLTGDADLLDGEGEDDAAGEGRGELLTRMDITIDDPRHETALGDHYVLAGRHHLVVAGVMRDWSKWSGLLTDGMILCPYPGPFTPFGSVPSKHPLLMVQPDTYIAGHILDRFTEVFGEDSVRKVT